MTHPNSEGTKTCVVCGALIQVDTVDIDGPDGMVKVEVTRTCPVDWRHNASNARAERLDG